MFTEESFIMAEVHGRERAPVTIMGGMACFEFETTLAGRPLPKLITR
jgi:hypothetical protein